VPSPTKLSTVHDPETGIGNGEVPDPDFPTYKVHVLERPTLLAATVSFSNKLAEQVTVNGPFPDL
jgi:hypothetical protein